MKPICTIALQLKQLLTLFLYSTYTFLSLLFYLETNNVILIVR